MSTDLTFLGAAGTVTGSRYLLHVGDHYYLVDCGLFQGGRSLKELNWQPFPIRPEQIDAVLLTHAHIDHVGYLPRLVRDGFRGPVYATQATCALLELVLPDAAHLQEQDAVYANKKGYSRHKPALPLYTAGDAEQALGLLKPVTFGQAAVLDDIGVTWHPAGHILGSAILSIEAGGRRVVFSGDLGRYTSEVMKPPAAIEQADVLLVESTYGNRLHAEEDIESILQTTLDHVIQHKGVLLIPAFAVGRTPQVLYHLRRLQDTLRIPSELPIFIDSPMAVDASHIYCRFGDDHNLSLNLLMDEHECPLRCKDTHFVREREESQALNERPGPAVIISASGMLTGGRILHHLKWRLLDPRNAVLFVGYQAEGTRGRLLLDGTHELRIHGETIPVKARIVQAQTLSGHADRAELLRWLSGFTHPPRQTYLVHGEPSGSEGLRDHIQQKLGWEAFIPKHGDSVSLTA